MKSSVLVNRLPPLRLQQVHDVQVLAPRLGQRALRRQEVDVRIAAEPSLRVHVRPALEPQRQLALPRLDSHPLPERLALEPSRNVHDDVAARQPALALAVYVRIGNLPKPNVAADVEVVRRQVGVGPVVMAIWLVRHALRRAKMHPARRRPARLVIQHGYPHPVPARVHQLEPRPRSLGHAVPVHVSPARRAYILAVPLQRQPRRGCGGHLHVGRARLGILRLAPALVRIAHELAGGRRGKRMGIRSVASVHLHVQRKGAAGIPRVLQRDTHRAHTLTRKRMLVSETERNGRHDEARPARDDLERLDAPARLRIAPYPQVIRPGESAQRLHRPPTGIAPAALVTRHQRRLCVYERIVRMAARNCPYLKPLAYRRPRLSPACQPKDVLRNVRPQRFVRRAHEAMGDYHVPRGRADRYRHAPRRPVQRNEARARGAAVRRAHQERQPPHRNPPSYCLAPIAHPAAESLADARRRPQAPPSRCCKGPTGLPAHSPSLSCPPLHYHTHSPVDLISICSSPSPSGSGTIAPVLCETCIAVITSSAFSPSRPVPTLSRSSMKHRTLSSAAP